MQGQEGWASDSLEQNTLRDAGNHNEADDSRNDAESLGRIADPPSGTSRFIAQLAPLNISYG
jgi:hypothetical protein